MGAEASKPDPAAQADSANAAPKAGPNPKQGPQVRRDIAKVEMLSDHSEWSVDDLPRLSAVSVLRVLASSQAAVFLPSPGCSRPPC